MGDQVLCLDRMKPLNSITVLTSSHNQDAYGLAASIKQMTLIVQGISQPAANLLVTSVSGSIV